MKIAGFGAGDRAWSAWCAIGNEALPTLRLRVWIKEVEVIMPEDGIVRAVASGKAESLFPWERLFATQQEAREAMAADMEAAAASLAKQAAELAEPVVVTV